MDDERDNSNDTDNEDAAGSSPSREPHEQPGTDRAQSVEERKALELSESARHGYITLPTDSGEPIDHQQLAPDGGDAAGDDGVQAAPANDASDQGDTAPADDGGDQ